MTAKQAEAIRLHFIEDLKQEEAAERSNVTQKVFYYNMQGGIKKLLKVFNAWNVKEVTVIYDTKDGFKKVYFAHPFEGNEVNLKKVERVIKNYVKENPEVIPVSPLHAFGYLYNEVDYTTGLGWCLALLKTCDVLVLSGEWRGSMGCTVERQIAEWNGIEVVEYKGGGE